MYISYESVDRGPAKLLYEYKGSGAVPCGRPAVSAGAAAAAAGSAAAIAAPETTVSSSLPPALHRVVYPTYQVH